ncbi:MAG: ferrous iron transporter B, partial [Pirellulaceae bacterium]|nr:ferrous iron transporter B [Pirellulaceae bacterium]
MAPSDSLPIVHVALIGNPNTGKSTLFGALVGTQQRVGNYPGVTVEKKTGRFATESRCYDVVDLPGLYSLSPRGRDEMVVLDLLLGRISDTPPIDLIVFIADATNLRRNFYLLSQLLELELPTVVALNKLDLAEEHGEAVDVERLQSRLPVPVVPIQANRGRGIDDLKHALDRLEVGRPNKPETPLPAVIEAEVAELAPYLEEFFGCMSPGITSHWFARRLLLDEGGYLEAMLHGGPGCPRRRHHHRHGRDDRGCGRGELLNRLMIARRRLVEQGCRIPGVEPEARYAWAETILDGVASPSKHDRVNLSDRLDRVLTHPVWGTSIFALVMFVVFQAVFSWAQPLMKGIESGIGSLGDVLMARLAETTLAGGAVESLLVHGVLGGVGSVLSFLPQILILFVFIALLEQCGYMARAAFLMDKLMSRVGLNGKSFIPLLCSYACAIPGIMAARVIDNERSRLVTILIAPLMTCSARLPIYTLLIGAFVPQRRFLGGLVNLQGLVLIGLYVFGAVTAVAVAAVLKRTLLRGTSPPLLMEMPAYQWPSLRTVFFRVYERGWLFVKAAGTMILAVSILVWAALYYPRPAEVGAAFAPRRAALEASLDRIAADEPGRSAIESELAQLDRDVEAAYQRQSVLGRMGRFIEPVVRPLGWDWRIGSAV